MCRRSSRGCSRFFKHISHFLNTTNVKIPVMLFLFIHYILFLYTIDAALTPFLNADLTIDCLYFNSCVILFI